MKTPSSNSLSGNLPKGGNYLPGSANLAKFQSGLKKFSRVSGKQMSDPNSQANLLKAFAPGAKIPKGAKKMPKGYSPKYQP